MIKQMIAGVMLLLGGAFFQVYASEVVDLNSATAERIEKQLSGIGLVKAQRIVKHREQHGPYMKLDDLLAVSGIGKKTLESIRGQVILGKGDHGVE